MTSKLTRHNNRFPVVEVSPHIARESPIRARTPVDDPTTCDLGSNRPNFSDMRRTLLLAAFPLEYSDSAWLVDTNSTALTLLTSLADRYRKHLESLPEQDVATQYESYKTSGRQGLFKEANCRRACRLPCWSAEEAAFYSFGLEFPGEAGLDVVRKDNATIEAESSQREPVDQRGDPQRIPVELTFSAHLLERLDLIQRAIRVKELPESIQPGQFIRWAERRRIRLPYALMSGAKTEAAEIEDWRDRYEAAQEFLAQREREHDEEQSKHLTEMADLKREIVRLKKHIESLISHGDDPRLMRIDAQQNMQTMLICMAREKYGWDKSNDAAAKQIATATASVVDGGLGTDTIKRRLREAKDYLDGLKAR